MNSELLHKAQTIANNEGIHGTALLLDMMSETGKHRWLFCEPLPVVHVPVHQEAPPVRCSDWYDDLSAMPLSVTSYRFQGHVIVPELGKHFRVYLRAE